MCREMMDAMRQSRKMTKVSFFSWCWNIVLLLPHSIAIVLAFPNLILSQGVPCPALPCPALPCPALVDEYELGVVICKLVITPVQKLCQ